MFRGISSFSDKPKTSLEVGDGTSTTLGIVSGLGSTEYDFEIRCDSDNAAGGDYKIEINGETTVTNYWIDTSVAVAANSNTIALVSNASGLHILSGKIFIDNNGKLMIFYDSYFDLTGTGTPTLVRGMLYMTVAQTAINTVEMKEITTGGNFKSSAYIKLTEVTK
jgi:hypothetical protein